MIVNDSLVNDKCVKFHSRQLPNNGFWQTYGHILNFLVDIGMFSRMDGHGILGRNEISTMDCTYK